MKTIIERGASWTLEETKILLHLWGQDLVQRSTTNTKRTKEVYEKISERFNQAGFERTADQVRTRIFNMIAEYRRILKDPNNPGRREKCIFFEALHRIYKAKHMDDVKSALDDYEPEYLYSPVSNTVPSEKGDESVSDSEATDGNETNNQAATNNSNSNSNNNLASSGNSNQNSTTSKNNNNNGDSNNNKNSNNNDEKESASAASHTNSGSSGGSKRIKLESPKSSEKTSLASVGTAAAAAASTTSSSTTTQATASTSTDQREHSKQTKTSHNQQQQVPLVGTSGTATIGAANLNASSCSSTASSSSNSSQRHQSLLLPHATTSSTSSQATTTSIGKLATNSGGNNTPSYININSTKLPIIRTNQLIGHSNGNESVNLNGTTTRLPTTAAITSHQLYQAPVNTFDVTSSALLIDRTFAHLSRENENMREWIALEKERLSIERIRRQQETEREVRRERVLIDTLMRFQEQWLAFLSRIDPKLLQNPDDPPPELKIPTKDNNGNLTTGETSSQPNSGTQQTTTTTTTTSTPTSSLSTPQSTDPNSSTDGGKV